MQSNRDLDRRVAEALGWPNVNHPDEAWLNAHLPPYSTDFGPRTDEKWAWLRERGDIEVGTHTGGVIVYLLRYGPRSNVSVEAPDLKEALARLVVAVAEREREAFGDE